MQRASNMSHALSTTFTHQTLRGKQTQSVKLYLAKQL